MTFFQRTTIAPQARRIALAATTALALSLAATTGIAQPAGPMMHGGHGMHGAGAGFEQMIPHMLEQAKASLNLNTSQQTMWDSVVAQGKAARDAGRANHQKVKDAMQAELAKTEPDLAADCCRRRRCRAAEPCAAQAGARPMARALRHVLARPEGRGPRPSAKEDRAGGIVPPADAANGSSSTSRRQEAED